MTLDNKNTDFSDLEGLRERYINLKARVAAQAEAGKRRKAKRQIPPKERPDASKPPAEAGDTEQSLETFKARQRALLMVFYAKLFASIVALTVVGLLGSLIYFSFKSQSLPNAQEAASILSDFYSVLSAIAGAN